MRRFPSAALAACVSALALAAPGLAITNGQPDTSHGAVGALLADFPGFGVFPTCTGTLVAPTKFLTSTHCFTDIGDGTVVGVTFDPDPTAGSPIAVASVADMQPGWSGDPFTDLSIVTLASAAGGIALPALPALGTLDDAKKTARHYDVVGYGTHGFGPAQEPIFPDVRRWTTATFISYLLPPNGKKGDSSISSMLKLGTTGSPGAGACFGDSGGPNFLAGTNVLAAVTTVGQKLCSGVYGALRLDTAPVRAFLAANGVAVP